MSCPQNTNEKAGAARPLPERKALRGGLPVLRRGSASHFPRSCITRGQPVVVTVSSAARTEERPPLLPTEQQQRQQPWAWGSPVGRALGSRLWALESWVFAEVTGEGSCQGNSPKQSVGHHQSQVQHKGTSRKHYESLSPQFWSLWSPPCEIQHLKMCCVQQINVMPLKQVQITFPELSSYISKTSTISNH